jgi:hypothetical protein
MRNPLSEEHVDADGNRRARTGPCVVQQDREDSDAAHPVQRGPVPSAVASHRGAALHEGSFVAAPVTLEVERGRACSESGWAFALEDRWQRGSLPSRDRLEQPERAIGHG